MDKDKTGRIYKHYRLIWDTYRTETVATLNKAKGELSAEDYLEVCRDYDNLEGESDDPIMQAEEFASTLGERKHV